MNSRKMKNINNDYIDLEVIRYFLNNETEYLIYSLNEIDETGYTKLYASKIIGNKASIITDNDEWLAVKEIIKQVVRRNRDGSELEMFDLDENNLDDVILQDTRVFKLQGNLVNLLSENKKVEKKEEVEIPEPVEEYQDVEEETIDMDYEELYNEQIDKNKELEIKIKELEEELNSYKERMKKIVSILNED